MSNSLLPFTYGPTGRHLVVDASGRLIATGDSGTDGYVLGYGDTGRSLVVDASGRLILSALSPSLGGGGTGQTNTASNLGNGSGIYAQKMGVDLQFKSLTPGTNVTFVGSSSGITINATDTGEANTASNLGAGSGLFYQKTGSDLEFKSLLAGSNITLVGTTSGITISSSAAGGTSWSDPIDASLIPDTTNTYDLGSSGVKFRNGYFAGKLTVEGGVDPIYIQLAPVDPTAHSIPSGSLYIDSTDSNKLKYKTSAGSVTDALSTGAAATYDATASGVANGATSSVNVASPGTGSAVEEGLLVKVQLYDLSSIGTGDVTVQIYNDNARTDNIYERVFDLSQSLIDTIPSHWMATSGSLYCDITNDTGTEGNFQVTARVASVINVSATDSGSSGSGVSSSTAGDGLSYSSPRLSVDLDSTPGLELTGASPNKKLRVKTSTGLTRQAAGLAVDSTVVRTTTDQTMAGQKRFSESMLGLTPASVAGPPTSGTYYRGDIFLGSGLQWFECTASGTPGTWQLHGWSYEQGISLSETAGSDPVTYTATVAAGATVNVELNTGISTSADGGRRGIIRKLNVWASTVGHASGTLDEPFSIYCYPNENRYGREQVWSINGQARKATITAAATGGTDNVLDMDSVDVAAPGDLVRLRRLAATVGEEYARITVRRPSATQFDLDEAVINSFSAEDPLMVVTEFVELPFLNNSAVAGNRDKIYLKFKNDGDTSMIFGYQADIENIGGGPSIS